VAIREAATVVLLRDSGAGPGTGIETWLMRRVPKMAFAAGMSVFPGGAVDSTDACPAGDGPADGRAAAEGGTADPLRSTAQQLSTTTGHAGALVCAAIRETFEEVGVLLVRPEAPLLEPELRVAVESRELPFATMLADLNVTLDVAAVRPWARWITPEGESRRYDTYFFVAILPDGIDAAAVTSEASHADWISVDEALAEYSRGERPMLPPTISTLTEISRHATAADVLAAAGQRSIDPVEPVIRQNVDGTWVASIPGIVDEWLL
jgi:8-oxo-dGTP pyrophosphatase MutT (NUDIX family)